MARKIEYQIGFTADTNLLLAALKQASTALQDVGNNASNRLTTDLRSAADAALLLETHLKNAYNVETGKLDLSKFSLSLSQSGMTLEQYRLRLSTIGVEGELAFLKVAQAIAAAELPMRRSNAALDKLWITMKNTLRWQLTSGMLHGFIGAVLTAYGYTQDLNESLNSIRIVTQKSVEDMDKFAVKANEAAQTLSTTTTRYTDAALIYYQQGLSDEEVEGRVQTTIKLANAAGESAETASQQLTAVWNNFYDGTKSLEYYADVMTALGATTASSTQEISQGLQKFAAVADTVGLSYEYAAAALATVTATTRESADIVGTAFRTLFGRLESLKLGDTLDDGTTLNKYSQALKVAGVDIKDVTGNLKDMDDILDETGERWQTLSRDQQMALAQTVAGVRQYAQFIALMDNWDFFKENLDTALNAEGSLQQLADIFAESWEAARNRVRAAAEEIYGDIIDDKAFIGMADGLTTVLNRVDDMVVALGGLKGILNTVLLLTTTLYGDKIAQGINDRIYNLGLMMGIEAQLAIQTQQRMMTQAQNTSSEIGLLNELSTTQILVAREAMEIDIEVTRASRDLTESQMELINNEKELVQAISKRTESYLEMARTARDANNSIKESIRELDPTFNQGTFDNNFVGNRTNQRNLVNALGLNSYKDFDPGMLDTVIDRYEELRMTAARLTEQQRTVGEVNGRNSAEYLALSNSIRSVNAQSGALLTVMRSYDGLNINQIVGTFRENAESMGASTERATLELEHMRQKAQDVAVALEQARNAGRDFGTIVNDLARGLMGVQMGITGIQSLGRVFSDEDMDAGQRLTTILSSLISLSFAYSGVHDLLARRVAATTATEVISNQVLAALNANQTTGIVITAQDGLSKLQAAVATKVLADAEGKLSIEVAQRNAMMAAGLVGLLPYIAIFAAVAGAIYLGVKAYNADADAAKDAAAAHEKAAKAATEAKDAYSDLTKTIEGYDKAVAAISDLTAGTDEYTDAVEQANEKARELLETYKELRAYSHYENGLLIIDEDALKEVLNLAKQRRADAATYSNYTDLTAQRALNTASRTDAMRSLNANLGLFSEKVTEAEFDRIVSYVMENGLLPELHNITSNFTGWDVGTFNKGIEATRDKLFALADALKETEKNAEALSIEMARSSLSSNASYAALGASQLDAVAAIIGRGLTEDKINAALNRLFNQYYEEQSANALASQYAKAMGYDATSKEDNWNRTKASFLDSSGTRTEKISYEDMARYLAAINAVNTATDEATESTIRFVDQVAKAGQKIGGQKVENELLGFLSGDKKIDSTAFSPQEIAEFRKGLEDISNISSEAWETSGFESAEDYCDAVRKALDEYDAQAWEDAIFDKYMQIANTGRKALEYMADTKKGGLLDEDTIQALQQQFAGIFDFSGLGTLSLKDQVLSVTEALRTLDDPKDAIEAMKKRSKAIEDYEKKIESVQQRAYIAGDKLAEKSLKEYLEALDKLTLGVDSKEAKRQLEKQIEELRKIDPIKLKVEIDRASAEALLGTMQRAAKLVEKDFTVTADNVSELASLMPEYFENATIDVATGLVQLDKDSVQAMTDIAIAAAGLNRDAAIALLNERVETTSAELAIMRDMYSQINVASADSASKLIQDAGFTEQQIGMASKKTLMNKIKDFLDEADAHGSLASKEVQDLNKVAEASAEQGKITALNWHQAAEDIYSSLHSAFVNAKANADLFKNDELIQDYKGAISNVNLNGYQRSASDTSWTYEIYNSQYKALRDFYNAGGNFSEMDFTGWSDDAITAFAVELADLVGEVLGEGSDFGVSDLYKLDDKYIAEVGKTINQSDYADLFDRIVNARSDLSQEEKNRLAQAALAGGISYGDYTLGQLFKDLATYAGLDVDNLFKKDKSGSSRTPTQKLDEEKQEEEEERYHRINRLIKEQDRLLDNLATEEERAYGAGRLKIFEDEIKEINQLVGYYKEKLDEALKTWLPKDISKVKEFFSNTDIQDGVITNIDKLIDDSIDKYNAAVKTYNDWITNTWNTASAEAQQTLKETKEVYDHALKEAKALYDQEQKALGQYEETIDLIRELEDDIADKMREERDKELNEITYKMEVVLDLKQLKQDVNNFMKDIAESYGDALTHTLDNANFRGVAGLMTDNALLELDTFASYVEEYNKLKEYAASNEGYDDIDATRKAMEDLTHNIIDSGEALLEWIDYWENMVPEAVEAARERFNQFTDLLEHNVTVLDTIKELYALQGQTYKTQLGFDRLQRVSQERMEAQLASSVLNRKWYERAAADLLNALNELDRYLANGGTEQGVEYDYLKNARDAFLTEFNEAQEAYLKSAQEAMETARDMYVQQIERAAYEFAQAATSSGDLDFWGEQYDHFIEGEEHYLDAVNRAYQENTWNSKIQLDYDNDILKTHHDLIKAFEDEKNALFARNKINEYDLEVLEARYKVLQAQMALEDAENAKNNLQLVRDRQGNWNYRYTSNPDDIAAAQQDLADAQNDWYNIAKQQTKDVTGEIVATWKEAQDAIREIWEDDELDEAEKSERSLELQRYYSEKMQDLYNDRAQAMADMTEAGMNNLTDYENKYELTLAGMTSDNEDFQKALNEYLDLCRNDFREYESTIDDIATETHTDLDSMKRDVDAVSTATDTLKSSGVECATALWNTIDDIAAVAGSYTDLAIQIERVIKDMEELAIKQANDIEGYSGTGVGPTLTSSGGTLADYSVGMMYAAAKYGYGSAEYNRIANARDVKWDDNTRVTDEQREAWKTTEQWNQELKNSDMTVEKFGEKFGEGAIDAIEKWLKNPSSYDTGGYTGSWGASDGKLAILHEKELVLNQTDTANILAAVDGVRAIEQALDRNVAIALGSLIMRLGGYVAPAAPEQSSNTTNHFDVYFPNVTDHNEIELALRNLELDADQYVNRRTD